MKKRFTVSDEEKNRILGLHESFKNTNNIVVEQSSVEKGKIKYDFDKESKELINLGFTQGETPEPVDKYEVKTLNRGDGDVTFY